MSSKNICPKCAEENDREMFKNPHFNQQLLAKDKWIESLLQVIDDLEKKLEEPRADSCPTCGCNELLCGFPSECSSKNN